jgi:hypothetical protein
MLTFEPLATGIFSGMKTAIDAIQPGIDVMLKAVTILGAGFAALPGPIKAVFPILAGAVLLFRGFSVIQGIMSKVVTSVVVGFQAMASSVGGYVAEMATFMGIGEEAALAFGYTVEAALGPIAIAIGVAVVAWSLFAGSTSDAQQAAEGFTKTLDDQTGAWTANTDAYLENEAIGKKHTDQLNEAGIGLGRWKDAITSGSKSLLDNGTVLREATQATDYFSRGAEKSAENVDTLMGSLAGSASTRDKFIADLALSGLATRDLVTEFQTEAAAYDDKQSKLTAIAVSTNISTGMTKEAAKAAADAAAANKTQAESIQAVMDAQHAATDPVFAAIKAQLDVKKATEDYNKAVAEGKSGRDELARMTVAQAEAAISYRDAIGKLDVAQLKGDSTNEKVMSALVQLRQFGFEPTVSQVAMLTQAITENQLKLIAMKDPAQATTDALKEMEAQGVTPTKTAIDAYIGNLQAMEAKLSPDDPMRKNIDDTIARLTDFGNLHPDVNARVTVDDAEWTAWLAEHRILMAEAYGPNSRKRATGGLVSAGTAYMIGERGPEMFVPQTPGSIISADRVASMSVANSGGATATYITNVNATVHLPAGANGRDVVNAITEYERRNGRVFARA